MRATSNKLICEFHIFFLTLKVSDKITFGVIPGWKVYVTTFIPALSFSSKATVYHQTIFEMEIYFIDVDLCMQVE